MNIITFYDNIIVSHCLSQTKRKNCDRALDTNNCQKVPNSSFLVFSP